MRLYDNDIYRDDFMTLVYDLLHSDGTNDRANQIIDAFDSAPEVEAEPVQPNNPLTLDELREMDGEPVWVVSVSSINGFEGHWDICEWENGTVVLLPHCMESPDISLYGKTWLAYRRKPEERTT
ncbi:MAG: hypothetical protein HFG26_08945 [Provencibacterium sp.]|jgi:hypothetical protein|nr:hypothetical protein [Provencibacterium sp.]